ncbi:MAG: toll/interleukin-1 receptor domain-containing protein, partial [bacterium]|nr:toll/interleukin-1 receptor domain-containing protein [bacterium]
MKTIFISYSHKDETWKDRLVTQLKVLEMEDYFVVWDDRKIKTGDDWLPEIEKALDEADIAVLMVTADFLTSKFIKEKEIPTLLERREKEGLRVIPVIVKPCPWNAVEWLSKIQATPKDGHPLMGFDEFGIEKELAALAEKIYRRIRGEEQEPEDPTPEDETETPAPGTVS